MIPTKWDNWKAFRVWRAAVVRLAIRDRWKNDCEVAKHRTIARSLAHSICDCPKCLGRIVREDMLNNWPHCAAEIGK